MRILAVTLLVIGPLTGKAGVPEGLRLPPGFSIEIIADVPNARSMALGDDGVLFVSSRFGGYVYAISDYLGRQPAVFTLTEKLKLPNGVAFRNGDLYIAEPNRLLRLADIQGRLESPGQFEVVAEDLRGIKLHSWKYIAFGPDDKLYMGIGAPCNVCDEPDYGLIMRMESDGSQREVVARGIRNTVGFDWQPGSQHLWFTDNNRDMMGDDEPPGELNRVAEEGRHFGFPFCHGADTVEPEAELAALGECDEAEPPMLELPAHVAALGMVFYDGQMFPARYHNQILIAEHGSWNRSEKIGYRVMLVSLDAAGEKVVGYEPLVEGWLDPEGNVTGRPVDVKVALDGSLLISDDQEGRIYRVSYDAAKE